VDAQEVVTSVTPNRPTLVVGGGRGGEVNAAERVELLRDPSATARRISQICTSLTNQVGHTRPKSPRGKTHRIITYMLYCVNAIITIMLYSISAIEHEGCLAL
jgi:hypothetical protein